MKCYSSLKFGGYYNQNLYEALKKYGIYINKHVYTKKNFFL